jgi:dihydroflavonol-4-reductase
MKTTDQHKLAFVTGASGMLGSRVVLDLLLRGFSVRALIRNKSRITQFIQNISCYNDSSTVDIETIEWIEADIHDREKITQAVQNTDRVFHCAAMVSFNPNDRQAMFETNIEGTSLMVDICNEAGINCFCHVSSIAALGTGETDKPVTEEAAFAPEKKHSAYSKSKYNSEMQVWRGIEEGLNAVIVNPSIIIGPGNWNTGSPLFYKQLFKGLKFYPAGGTGFVDVRDVSAAMIELTDDTNFEKVKSKRFILNAENLLYKNFFEQVARSVNVPPPSILAQRWMLGIAWRASALALLLGIKSQISRDSILNSSSIINYDGSKIIKEIGFQYRSLTNTINEVGEMFKKTYTQ